MASPVVVDLTGAMASPVVVDLTGRGRRAAAQVERVLDAVRWQLIVDEFKRDCPRPDPRAGSGAFQDETPPSKKPRTRPARACPVERFAARLFAKGFFF